MSGSEAWEVVGRLASETGSLGNGVSTKPWAIGFVRWDISGSMVDHDVRVTRCCAARMGYGLVPMTVGPQGDPVARLLSAIARCGAHAVIVPSREHIWASRRAVTEICDLVVVAGDTVWERGHQWPRWFAR
ncbi:hypothetical protein ACIHDR_04720 [Nocardia sp. NPDC052278]|uniref:hypothetical protein n=1 Tax=unclassified Nocardia TaxID=2637762 RepID=UPI0036736D11